MDSKRWRQIDELFLEAAGCDPGARAALLDQKCRSDSDLRLQVESLLSAHDQPSSFIDLPAFKPRPGGPPLDPLGKTIGRYHLRRLIGSGGMGAVYEAQQESPHRIVAIKLLRTLPCQDPWTETLFRREGQALARLQHPGIASIYEAGRCEGWHYFAMEHVAGTPLTRYVCKNGLGIHERLALFCRICEAVHYAHQRGVIHRDLKPSNILVTDSAQPKILDFGLARVVDPDAEFTLITQPGAFQGTPAYASPEQACGRTADVDARSDVYALGVILYELLTGQHPYCLEGLQLSDATRVICEKEPRPFCPADRQLRGELETIVRMALEKEPCRRYSGVAALAEDIGRFLNHQPILAHPPSAWYQLRKFTRRHTGLVLSVSVILVLLIAGFATTSVLLSRSMAAEATAAHLADAEGRQRRVAEGLFRFVSDRMFGCIDPGRPQVADSRLREVLDAAAKRAQINEARPAQAAAIRMMLGCAYERLGCTVEAADQFNRAARLRSERLGDNHPETLDALQALARCHFVQGELDAAVSYARDVLYRCRLAFDEQDTNTLNAMTSLGYLLLHQSAHDEAVQILRSVEQRRRVTLGLQHAQTIMTRGLLAEALFMQGHRGDAENLLVEALNDARSARGDGDRRTLEIMVRTARILRLNQKLADAEALCRAALEQYAKSLGSDHFETLAARYEWAQLLQATGQPNEARDELAGVEDTTRRLHGERSVARLAAGASLAEILRVQDAYGAAQPMVNDVMSQMLETAAEHDPVLLRSMEKQVESLRRAGRLEQAESLCRETVEHRRRVLGPDDRGTLYSVDELARILMYQKRYAEALPLFTEAYEGRRRVLGEDHDRTLTTMVNIGWSLHALGRLAEAEHYYRNCFLGRRKTLGATHRSTVRAMGQLGRNLLAQKKLEEAEKLLREALDIVVENGLHDAAMLRDAQTMEITIALTDMLEAGDRLRECEPVLQSAWAVFNETFGEAQSQTRKLAKRLADVRARLGGNDANHAPAKTPS